MYETMMIYGYLLRRINALLKNMHLNSYTIEYCDSRKIFTIKSGNRILIRYSESWVKFGDGLKDFEFEGINYEEAVLEIEDMIINSDLMDLLD